MPLYFKSLCSSSSGNCLTLWTENTRILIDCGLSSMKKTRQLLNENIDNPEEIDAVIISHLHGDHISYYPLRVIEDYNYKVKVHKK
jgi:Cft2 family RNA processing exonuclease